VRRVRPSGKMRLGGVKTPLGACHAKCRSSFPHRRSADPLSRKGRSPGAMLPGRPGILSLRRRVRRPQSRNGIGLARRSAILHAALLLGLHLPSGVAPGGPERLQLRQVSVELGDHEGTVRRSSPARARQTVERSTRPSPAPGPARGGCRVPRHEGAADREGSASVEGSCAHRAAM